MARYGRECGQMGIDAVSAARTGATGGWRSLTAPGDPTTGYFGPDSVPWRLYQHPCVAAAAVYNAIVFELYPPCAVLSDQVDSLYMDPIGRARRTLGYVYSVLYGDVQTADRAAAFVRDLHDNIAPVQVNGRMHRVADPDNLLWLHMSQGDAILRAHAAYGEGVLTDGERDDFWRQFAPFAQLQGVPLDMIPTSSAEADVYFARIWPQLELTDAGRRAFEQVMNPQGLSWEWASIKVPLGLVVRSGVALLPRDLKQMIGVGRFDLSVEASRHLGRPLYRALTLPGARDILPAVAQPNSADLLRGVRETANAVTTAI